MRRLARLRSITHVMVLIVACWTVLFAYHERYLPYRAAARCRWPQINAAAADHQVVDDQNPDQVASNEVINVMLVADPQLIDNHTYPGRNSVLLKVSEHTADVYLKKNYHAMVRALRPDYVFFLGDYLDNGRLSSDSYFRGQLRRFNRIFKRAGYKKGKRWMVNTAGNHDIGWADGVKVPARQRFEKHFGRANKVKVINNVEFVALDTISLSAMEEPIYGQAREFYDTHFGASIVKTKPRVLLSHVPLFRDTAKLTCGPLRESSVFHTSKGYQYQLVLSPELSADLLARVQPDLIFSGDDHDYCDVAHPGPDGHSFREITVKSISMAMGIRYPAIQVLSFANGGNDNDYTLHNPFRYDTHLCYLPTPYINIACYVVAAVVSGLAILWYDIARKPRYTPLPVASVSTSRKISAFLREQDELAEPAIGSLPQYTHTATEPVGGRLPDFAAWLQRSQLIPFFKHASLTAVWVVLVYALFVITL